MEGNENEVTGNQCNTSGRAESDFDVAAAKSQLPAESYPQHRKKYRVKDGKRPEKGLVESCTALVKNVGIVVYETYPQSSIRDWGKV